MLRAGHGNVPVSVSAIHGVENPCLVIESKITGYYQVVYHPDDSDALKVFAKALDLTVAEEEREISALTLKTSLRGHRLTAAERDEFVDLDAVCIREGRW